ncbi:MAG: PTS sugar transporter subunit IIA [Neisseria sp.]|nr:PTS sugar transporter subunit IIA [Neisseria sp.]
MIAVLVITHEHIGAAYSALVKHFFNDVPPHIALIGVMPDQDLDNVRQSVENALAAFPENSGVLALTDIFGATPFNAARRFVSPDFSLLAGLNAPMMVKAVQYSAEANNLHDFAAAVRDAGIRGIVFSETEQGDRPC